MLQWISSKLTYRTSGYKGYQNNDLRVPYDQLDGESPETRQGIRDGGWVPVQGWGMLPGQGQRQYNGLCNIPFRVQIYSRR
jgi:hypothetical protein